ncbi:hypothetical protein N7495_004445, partial [Penicillium taxi]|uniref:uncharacterized protein n=1 Tax=Penicillium taxi TaxID=168475 RepID=UPI002545398A
MSNIDEDVGHTVIHFLYTGGYETVNSPLEEGTSDLAREYKRSVLVYHASRTWGLTDLEILAQQKMQQLDEELPVLEILRVMRDVFSSLPAGETWLPGYIQGNLQRLLTSDDPWLDLCEFYDIIGQNHQFDNAVMKMIIEILSIRLVSMKDQHVKTPNSIISNESPLQGPISKEPEPSLEETEYLPEQTECLPEEPDYLPEETEYLPEEPDYLPEETEYLPEETECLPEEPEYLPEETGCLPEETECLPEETECLPEEPEPVLEEPEPVLKERPAERDSELWTISRVPADADSWLRASLLPGDTPNAEILQEASDQGHIARISSEDLT